jgi:hypothetical protein
VRRSVGKPARTRRSRAWRLARCDFIADFIGDDGCELPADEQAAIRAEVYGPTGSGTMPA